MDIFKSKKRKLEDMEDELAGLEAKLRSLKESFTRMSKGGMYIIDDIAATEQQIGVLKSKINRLREVLAGNRIADKFPTVLK